jgi:hypothetical protein
VLIEIVVVVFVVVAAAAAVADNGTQASELT